MTHDSQKNEHIPKKIKLYDQIIHFIHSDKHFIPGQKYYMIRLSDQINLPVRKRPNMYG